MREKTRRIEEMEAKRQRKKGRRRTDGKDETKLRKKRYRQKNVKKIRGKKKT